MLQTNEAVWYQRLEPPLPPLLPPRLEPPRLCDPPLDEPRLELLRLPPRLEPPELPRFPPRLPDEPEFPLLRESAMMLISSLMGAGCLREHMLAGLSRRQARPSA